MKHKVDIYCPDSVVLEGLLEIPDSTVNPIGCALVCHPHPLYGGDMYNNVVSELCETFLSQGIATLRFNFRGVGRSTGSYGEGVSEMIDVTSCLDFLASDARLSSSRILLGGYSFGSWVSMKAAVTDDRPTSLIMISPPVDMYDFSFLREEKRPKLMVTGDRDFVCSVKGFKELSIIAGEPKMSAILKGHDHFHGGNEDAISKIVREFLAKYPS